MPGPYPLPTLGPTIDLHGITAPPFEDILASLTASYQQIYGSDAYLTPDSQDGQWIAIQAQAIYDQNQAVIAAYLSYSPTNAQGIGLSAAVKINGLRRLSPSYGTVELQLIGQAGTVIENGRVTDVYGFTWALPPQVIIPYHGQITVSAICTTVGAIAAEPDTITQIATPVPGWQVVTNPSAAFAGLPVEVDAALRRRQARSTALPAQTPRESIEAAIANIQGVGRVHVYDNDTDMFSPEGIPPHSICLVVEAGDAETIARTVALKKNTGCGTFGDTEVVVFDSHGVPNTIDFYYLTLLPIFVQITVQPLPGYMSTSEQLMLNAVIQYLNTLDIFESVYAERLYAPANLMGQAAQDSAPTMTARQLQAQSETYVIRDIRIGIDPSALSDKDISIPFNAAASCNQSTIAVTLLTTN